MEAPEGQARPTDLWPLPLRFVGVCIATPHLIAAAKKVFLSLSPPLFPEKTRAVFRCNYNYCDRRQKRFLWLGAVHSCCVFAAFLLSKNTARSQSLEAQGSCCSFWPKLPNYLNLSKIRPCLAEIGPTLFQPNQQERTAPNQRNRLCMLNRNGSILEVIFSFHWCFVRVPRCAF